MDAVKFLKEWKRMCVEMEHCGDCEAHKICPYPNCNYPYMQSKPSAVVPFVERWSSAHPQKTRLNDFLEKHQKAILADDGIPKCCANSLGYCENCVFDEYGCRDCKTCWNTPL